MIKNCIYFCEGPCDISLLNALRREPSLILPGRMKEFNVIQNQITTSMLLAIKPGTTVVFVFDTDKEITDKLKKSIKLIHERCPKTKIVFLMQVKNLEDELVRCTDIKKVTDLTQSNSLSNFKTAFCRITNLRDLLDRHKINVNQLWTTKPSEIFEFIPLNSYEIKTKSSISNR